MFLNAYAIPCLPPSGLRPGSNFIMFQQKNQYTRVEKVVLGVTQFLIRLQQAAGNGGQQYTTLGRMCSVMIRRLPAPIHWTLFTPFCALHLEDSARTTQVKLGINKMPKTRIILYVPPLVKLRTQHQQHAGEGGQGITEPGQGRSEGNIECPETCMQHRREISHDLAE